MRSYGIMQGRLTPSNGRGIQFFPFDNWKQEFYDCKQLGLNEIEWIFDYDRYEENPLWTKQGIIELKEVIVDTGIDVHSVCFDYFMRHPFFKLKNAADDVKGENIEFIKRVTDGMCGIGASLLEIPLVDDSSIENEDEGRAVIDFLHQILDITDQTGILIGCETDLPVGAFRRFLDDVSHERIRANYDSGNSSGLGYNHKDELLSLSEYVANVHIKDRELQGTTMPLGKGNADFDAIFSSLNAINYGGSIILQAARGDDGFEKENIASQLEFVKKYSHEYGLG